MNHDITHCANDFCKVKDECLRYQAHLEVLRSKPIGMYYSYVNHNEGEWNTGDENCELLKTV